MRLSLSSFLPWPIIWDKDTAYPQNWVRFAVALPANIRLGCKLLPVENALAYNFAIFITVVKRFVIQAHGRQTVREGSVQLASSLS